MMSEQMTDKIAEFNQAMDRYEDGARERRQRSVEEAFSAVSESERKQAVYDLNIQRRETHVGTTPIEVLDEEDAAICETFIERMSKQDFPGAAVLKNEIVNESTVRRFYRRLLGQRPTIEPYSIRGYQVGVVSESTADYRGEELRTYLCEDGRLRALSTTHLSNLANSFDESEERKVRDLPYDPRDGQLAKITPVEGGRTHTEHGKAQVSSIQDILLHHMMSDAYVQAQAD